ASNSRGCTCCKNTRRYSRSRSAAVLNTECPMTRFPNLGRVERLLPGAATLLTLSLAVTLRVESSCSDASRPAPQPSPSVLYQNPEILWAEGALTASAYPSEAFLSSAMS